MFTTPKLTQVYRGIGLDIKRLHTNKDHRTEVAVETKFIMETMS